MSKEKNAAEQFDYSAEAISEAIKPFSNLKKKDAARALQTYFRSSFRVQMNMAAMADRKANIMIRLNSILISGMVIFYRNVVSIGDLAVVTVVIFLITLLASLIFATFAARPNMASITVDKDVPPKKAAEQLFFFTHYAAMGPDDYEEAFGLMMKDTGLIYGGMARDLHVYGKLLVHKYRLLRMSYNIFILGLAMTVVSFLLLIIF